MAKTAPKNFRTALDEKLARELLNVAPRPSAVPTDTPDGPSPDPSDSVPREILPLGERLRWAVEHLASVVKEANAHLEDSELSRHLAEALCARKSRRGFPYIHVDDAGQVMLEVSYDGKQQVRSSKKKRKYKRELPLLEDLRKEAGQLGISVSHLGQKRRAIYDYLQEIKSRHASKPSEEETEAQMAAGHDEVTVTEPKNGPKPPKKRRQIKLVTPGTQPAEPKEPEAKPSPNLTRLLEQGADLDIEDILSDET